LELDLEAILSRSLLIGVRLGSLLVFAPFFSNTAVSPRIKAGLTIILTALLYPVYPALPLPLGWPAWLSLMSSEFLVGLMMGLTLQFIFDGLRLAGQLAGFQLGFSLANLIDPQSQVDTPVLSVFHQSIALLIFLQFDVHHWLLRGMGKSFEYLPPGTAVASLGVTEELLRLAGGMFVIALQVAAPVLLATMITDVALGFLGKASPQLPILFVGLSIKSLVGFTVLMGTVAYWPNVLERHFLGGIQSLERVLHLAQ